MNIDEFALSEYEAEKPKDKTDTGDKMDDDETFEEPDESFSAKTRRVERASYLSDQPIGIFHCFPSRYHFEWIGKEKL